MCGSDKGKRAGMRKNKHHQAVKTLIYCGPTIPNVIRENAAFQGGLPKSYLDFCAKCPAAAALLVELKNFPKARRDVRIVGTAMHSYYSTVQKYIEEE